MSIMEKLYQAVTLGHPGDAGELVQEALDRGIAPEKIVDEAMMPAMRDVGERYKDNEADIPNILMSARCVRVGFDLIEKRNDGQKQGTIGTVILGTVEGDLHDMGKNLVAIMFRSAGFKVIDLGVDNSDKQFLRAVDENPDVSIVCISSLLSTAIPGMKQVVRALRKKDPEKKYKIMVGGGAVTQQLADSMGADAYTENCVEAAEVAKTFIV